MVEQPIMKCQLEYSEKGLLEERYHMVDDKGRAIPEEVGVDIGQDPWPYKIPEIMKILPWTLINHTPDIVSEYIQQRVFATAFRSIGFLITKKYRFVDNVDDAFFKIEFLKDLAVFDNKTGVLAQAYLFHPNSSFNGVIQFNDNHFFTPLGKSMSAHLVDPVHYPDINTIVKLQTQPMLEIAMHEIDHSHGFRHDLLEKLALMYPYVKPGYIFNSEKQKWEVNPKAFLWHSNDKWRWRQGYEGRRIPARWMDYFQQRRIKGLDYL